MQKRIALIFVLLMTPILSVSAATDAQLLKKNLEKFNQIDAEFTQVVSSDSGKILNKSSGNLIIVRPGKFRWQVEMPEEELIVSNGHTMWLYTPFIEQVTLINLKDAIQGTPFILLSGANDQQWANYNVVKNNNIFTVKSASIKEQSNTFTFEFSGNGSIEKFVVIEPQGQKSAFTLNHKASLTDITANLFEFKIPEGVEIDDQR